MADKEKLYRTSDIYFAAYLSALDVPLVGSEWNTDRERPYKVFVFKVKGADLERFKSGFFGNSGTVRVRRYVDALRSIKAMCHV